MATESAAGGTGPIDFRAAKRGIQEKRAASVEERDNKLVRVLSRFARVGAVMLQKGIPLGIPLDYTAAPGVHMLVELEGNRELNIHSSLPGMEGILRVYPGAVPAYLGDMSAEEQERHADAMKYSGGMIAWWKGQDANEDPTAVFGYVPYETVLKLFEMPVRPEGRRVGENAAEEELVLGIATKIANVMLQNPSGVRVTPVMHG